MGGRFVFHVLFCILYVRFCGVGYWLKEAGCMLSYTIHIPRQFIVTTRLEEILLRARKIELLARIRTKNTCSIGIAFIYSF